MGNALHNQYIKWAASSCIRGISTWRALEFVHGERKIHHDARESAKEDARKLTGLTAADVSRLSNAGHDYASGKKAGGLAGEKLRHFDEFAQELAKSHPELGLGDSNDAAAALWDVLGEGKRSMVAKHDPEVIDEAVRLIHASGGRNYVDDDLDAVPFSTDQNGLEHAPKGTSKGGEFVSKASNFASPSRHEGMPLAAAMKEAKRASTSESLKRVLGITNDLAGGVTSVMGIGHWDDGTEPTFTFRFHKPITEAKLKYIAAWQGLILRQKAVLPFHYDDNGNDVLWTATISGDIKKAAAFLRATKMHEYCTLHQLAKGQTLVHFFDKDANLTSTLNGWSKSHGIKITGTRGSGGTIPAEWDKREDSLDYFREAIRRYERQSPNDDHVRTAWARRCLQSGATWARPWQSGRRKRRGLGDQFSIADPPDRDRATSQPAKAKDSAAAAAPVLAGEIRRRLDKLLKKN